MVLKPYHYEIILVNDGSTDQTQEIIELLSIESKRVKFISFSRNFGHQKAIKAGIDFALDDGLLPASETKGKIKEQFYRLGELADIQEKQLVQIIKSMTSNEDKVLTLINASYLNEKTKRNYTQAYQTRLEKLLRA